MKAPKIIQLPYNWSTDRQGHKIVAIIAHNTVGTDSRDYLSRGGDMLDGRDKKVSIHVLIQKDGTIYRYVPDHIGANHAGFGKMPPPWTHINPNLCTLGFELENASDGVRRTDQYTDAQLLSMGWQIAQWRAAYGVLPLYRHADIDPLRRKDTVGLTVEQIEQWVTRAANSVYAPGVYRFGPLAVFERADLQGKIAKYLPSDSQADLEIDAVGGPGYAPTAGHLKDGSGFVDLRRLEKR